MGLPDDLLVPSPQVRPVIEHQFPTSDGGDAPHGVAPAASALRDEGWGPEFSSSLAWSRICSSAMSTKLLASSPCGLVFEFVRTFGDEKGPHSADPFLTCVFFVAGTGFEPVTSGL
jgi:hypothetical protein